MKIKMDGGAKMFTSRPQQVWDGSELMQTARFAGQRMEVITDDKGGFDLNYLGYEAGGFKTMDAAKAAAPEFAKTVLAQLSSLIKTEPESAPETPSL